MGTDPRVVEKLVLSLRRRTSRPLVVKLTPNVTDIAVIARAAEHAGADAVSCINTLVGMVIDTAARRFAIPAGTAGLSGPAIRPVGVAMTYKVARAVNIPVIGIGGIVTGDDAVQYLLAGASAVQVGTATFVDPSAPQKVLAGIQDYCSSNSIESVAGFHGIIE